jgi:hypothetical protein
MVNAMIPHNKKKKKAKVRGELGGGLSRGKSRKLKR